MKQVVTDMAEVLRSLPEELEKLRKIIDAQREEIRVLSQNIDGLNGRTRQTLWSAVQMLTQNCC